MARKALLCSARKTLRLDDPSFPAVRQHYAERAHRTFRHALEPAKESLGTGRRAHYKMAGHSSAPRAKQRRTRLKYTLLVSLYILRVGQERTSKEGRDAFTGRSLGGNITASWKTLGCSSRKAVVQSDSKTRLKSAPLRGMVKLKATVQFSELAGHAVYQFPCLQAPFFHHRQLLTDLQDGTLVGFDLTIFH